MGWHSEVIPVEDDFSQKSGIYHIEIRMYPPVSFELCFQFSQIAVDIVEALRVAETNTFDDASVIHGVTDHRVFKTEIVVGKEFQHLPPLLHPNCVLQWRSQCAFVLVEVFLV